MTRHNLTMPINANWQARFLLKLVEPVKVSRLQRHFANLANRVIGGVIEKESNQSIVNNVLKHIDDADKLRPPQREAIETYLWIKFVGNNKKLSDMVREGLLYDDHIAQKYNNYYTFRDDYVTQFFNQFFQDNDLKNLHKKLVNDPYSVKIDWNALLDKLLHNFDYANYLFSLPMGAGKTFLMACFIYLDLYFATLFKDDKRFAHNFVVFAPQASKTAILPSLRTIKDFNPEWILPKSETDKLTQTITIEILDSLSSKRKDKLHGNNPNLEKVNRLKQTKDFGLVFITNAEKVVLERYADKDKVVVESLKKGQSNLFDKSLDEIQKSNELRESLSQIPYLTVILDEVHHSYGTTGNGEKKLRQAVNILNQHKNVNSVIGLSGTPYVKTKIEIDQKEAVRGNQKNIRLNQIQDIVYNYPLNVGIGNFLKKPDIRKVDVKESVFIKQALDDFFSDYDVEYENGLVAVGTEGWDCKSLTSVVLPRQKTTKNFVLQTTTRCLREVDDASRENALIYLSEDNYETLDKELKDNYRLSISDLTGQRDDTIKVQVRKPKLGNLKYKQIDIKYKIIKKTSPEIRKELSGFNFAPIKKHFAFDKGIISGFIGRTGLTGEVTIKEIEANADALLSFSDFIYRLSANAYGLISESELETNYKKELANVYAQISKELEWITLNPNIDIANIIKGIAASLMDKIKYAKEVIEKETEIELLEWEGTDNEMSLISPSGSVYKFMPQIPKTDLLGRRGYGNHPEYIEEDFFGEDNNVDPQDISYNYVPYKMDSAFEQNALAEMLKLVELKDLEVYFNGYKDKKLQSFWIQTPRGRYTPDFLILKRERRKKYSKNQSIPLEKALIIETKGKPYYDDEFRAKERFVKEEFLTHNTHFSYHCFVDDGQNDFTKHLDTFKQILKDF